jgi:serine/threonine protein kinase
LSAVLFIHGLGHIHRDIKLENLLLTDNESLNVKLSDFGLSKNIEAGASLKLFCGTLHYMAPEIVV